MSDGEYFVTFDWGPTKVALGKAGDGPVVYTLKKGGQIHLALNKTTFEMLLEQVVKIKEE